MPCVICNNLSSGPGRRSERPLFVGLLALAPGDGHCCPRADGARAAAQGITLKHLRQSRHARQALETLLVAEQCENGRNICPPAVQQEEEQAAVEEEVAAEGDVVSGATVPPAEVLCQLSAANCSMSCP